MPVAPPTASRASVTAARTGPGVCSSIVRSTVEDATCWDTAGMPSWPTSEASSESTSAATATSRAAPAIRLSAPRRMRSVTADRARPSSPPSICPATSRTRTVASTAPTRYCGSTCALTHGAAENAATPPSTSPARENRELKKPRLNP